MTTRVLDNVVIVASLTAAARLAGGVKIAATANYFGAGDEFDAYQTAFLLPSLLGEAVTIAFTSALVPALTAARRQSQPAAHGLVRAALAVAVSLMTLLALLCALGSPAVVLALGSSFAPAKLQLARNLFLALLLWLPLGAWIATWRGVLHSHGEFTIAAGAQIAAPLLTVAWLWATGAASGTWALVTAVLLGAFAEAAVVASAAARLGYPLLPRTATRTPELASFIGQSRALILTALLASGGLLIDQALAGRLGTGAVSVQAYGTKLGGVLGVIFGTALGTVVLPDFSRLVASGDWTTLVHRLRRYSLTILAVLVPLAALVMWLSHPLAKLLFERGAFDSTHTSLVAAVQRFSVMELPFAALFIVTSRLTTALGRSRLLTLAGLAALPVNAFASWQFSQWWGVPGLALSATLTRVFLLAVLVVLLGRLHHVKVETAQ